MPPRQRIAGPDIASDLRGHAEPIFPRRISGNATVPRGTVDFVRAPRLATANLGDRLREVAIPFQGVHIKSSAHRTATWREPGARRESGGRDQSASGKSRDPIPAADQDQAARFVAGELQLSAQFFRFDVDSPLLDFEPADVVRANHARSLRTSSGKHSRNLERREQRVDMRHVSREVGAPDVEGAIENRRATDSVKCAANTAASGSKK